MHRAGRETLLLPAVLSLATWLRVRGLDEVPPGFYLDESALAYNAWLLGHHGIDQYGERWPLLFRALDDFKEPLFVYTTALWLRFTDLTVHNARLPAALWGILGVGVAYGLGRELLGESGGLWAALLTAVTPWHVHYSRWCEQALAMTVVHSAAVWLMARTIRTGRSADGAFAGVLLALTLYAYSPARLLVPATAAAFAVWAWWRGRLRDGGLWAFGATLAVACLPFAFAYGRHLEAVNLRFASTRLPVARWPLAFFSHLDPRFLFGTGDANPRHGTGSGLLPPYFGGLFLLGLAAGWRERWVLAMALLGLVLLGLGLGSFNADYPHATRTIACMPYVQVLAAWGVVRLQQHWPSVHFRAAVVALVLASAAVFWIRYSTVYRVQSARAWRSGLLPALQVAARLSEGRWSVVAPTAHYADWMFVTRTPASAILAHRAETAAGEDIYDPDDRRGKFEFVARSSDAASERRVLVLPAEWARPAECAWRSATHCVALVGTDGFTP